MSILEQKQLTLHTPTDATVRQQIESFWEQYALSSLDFRVIPLPELEEVGAAALGDGGQQLWALYADRAPQAGSDVCYLKVFGGAIAPAITTKTLADADVIQGDGSGNVVTYEEPFAGDRPVVASTTTVWYNTTDSQWRARLAGAAAGDVSNLLALFADAVVTDVYWIGDDEVFTSSPSANNLHVTGSILADDSADEVAALVQARSISVEDLQDPTKAYFYYDVLAGTIVRVTDYTAIGDNLARYMLQFAGSEAHSYFLSFQGVHDRGHSFGQGIAIGYHSEPDNHLDATEAARPNGWAIVTGT